MSNKLAIVTGANNGIGYETTLGLVKAGCSVVMACRNLDKAEKAREAIRLECSHAELTIMQLDLSDVDSVRSLGRSEIAL